MLSFKLRVSHLTIDLRTLVIVFKFEPSSLTYSIILFLKFYSYKTLISLFANVYPIVLEASNKLRVTCFHFQLHPQKIMTL
jgi:hypothetical protein